LPLPATKLPFDDYQIAVSENAFCYQIAVSCYQIAVICHQIAVSANPFCYQIAVSDSLLHLLPNCRSTGQENGHTREIRTLRPLSATKLPFCDQSVNHYFTAAGSTSA